MVALASGEENGRTDCLERTGEAGLLMDTGVAKVGGTEEVADRSSEWKARLESVANNLCFTDGQICSKRGWVARLELKGANEKLLVKRIL